MTQYTVSVRAGLPSDNGTTLTEGRIFGFYTAAATTEELEASLRFTVDDQTLVSPGAQAAVSYNSYVYNRLDGGVSPVSVTAEVYAFASADAASAAILKAAATRGAGAVSGTAGMLPTDGLTMVWSGDADKVAVDSWSRGENGWIYLPALDEGIYIVSFTAAAGSAAAELEMTAQTLLQVTPLRAFTESVYDPDNGTKTLIWAHRTDDGAPAVGSSITATLFENTVWRTQEQIDSGDDMAAFRSVTAQTDENGIAEFTSVMENADAALLHLRHVDKSLLLCAPLSEGTDTAICRCYVYTDRAVYFPDDTVRFWGVLGRVYENQPLPDVLSLSVAGNDTGVRVTVAEDGSFSGSFLIEDWTSSVISLGLTDDSGTVNYRNTLRVTQQDKPLYQLDISYDRPFYTLENPTANVTMTVSYFDGTPAAGITLHVSAQTDETLTTDENGVAVYTYTMPDPIVDSTAPQYSQLSVQISGYETATLYSYDYTFYYHSGGVFSSERLDNDRSRVTLHTLDTSALTARDDVYSLNGGYPDNVRGTPIDTDLSVVLKKTYYVRTKSDSTEYDPINRVTYNRYYYEQKQEIVDSFTAQTVN
ncbi:MAG: hypothetical protein IJ302_01420, partial [Clostridia bacterium]|nr:hypothetical protein [Clostridia bacterium]